VIIKISRLTDSFLVSYLLIFGHCTGTVHLSKKFKDETIDITFDCQDEAEMDMEDEAIDQAADTEDDEDMPEMEYGINFEVTITKPNGTKMVIACAASQKLVINTVRHIDADKDVADQELYGGPVFDHLDEQLQDAFHAYLSDRNVDEDLCFFILSFSREKEQKEYGAWLNKLLVFAE
jgi:complement component 1 Q subcomponent-binding protein